MGRVLRILSTAGLTDAMLALTGDKRFLLSPVAMPSSCIRCAAAADHDGRPGWRGCGPTCAGHCASRRPTRRRGVCCPTRHGRGAEIAIEMACRSVRKYGEEALVDLSTFTRLREAACGRCAIPNGAPARDGAQFEIVRPGTYRPFCPNFRTSPTPG